MRAFIVMALGLLLLLPLRAMADQPKIDPLARPNTKLAPGYIIALSVSVHATEEEELCGEFLVDRDGNIKIAVGNQPLPPVRVAGATCETVRTRVFNAIRKYYAVDPEITVGIAKIPRIRVLVEGATFRNGPLTLADGTHLSDALALTGFLPSADLQKVRITRTDDGGNKVRLTADLTKTLAGDATDDFSDPPLKDGDRITLDQTPTPVIPSTIAVLGEVRTPSVYSYKTGMTVRDALTAAYGMLPTADPDRVTIRRMKDNSYTTVNGLRAMQNVPTDNLKLQPDDTVFVMTRDSGLRYAVLGSVASPNTFEFKGAATLKQALVDAGGFKPEADRGRVLLVRNMLHDPAHAETVPVNYDRIARGEIPDVPLRAGDVVQVLPRRHQSSPLVDLGLMLLRFLIF